MQSSRDSSLWRSLAVAFGDGLAFGVGMKLTQAAGRQLTAPHSSAPARFDSNPLAGRIEQIEHDLKRIERVERAPVTASGSVDQKVLEAIINAVEARLAEHGGQVERRLADLDARLAIELRSLDQQDNSISKRISEEIAALQKQMVGVNRQFGEAVARIVAEQVSSQVRAHAAALEQSLPARIAGAVEAAVEPRLAAARSELQGSLATLVAEQVDSQVEARVSAWEQALPGRIALAVEAAMEPRLAAARRETQESLAALVAEQVASQVQARTAVLEASLQRQVPAAVEASVGTAVPDAVSARVGPLEQQLRAQVEQKDREIAELRQRLADIDSNVLELILGIGQICRQAAARLAPPEVSPEHVESAGPAAKTVNEQAPAVAEEDLTGSSSGEVAGASGSSIAKENGDRPEGAGEASLPGFAQSQKSNRLWRVPLVSSFVVATGALVFRHFVY
jgi:hypothetical protein